MNSTTMIAPSSSSTNRPEARATSAKIESPRLVAGSPGVGGNSVLHVGILISGARSGPAVVIGPRQSRQLSKSACRPGSGCLYARRSASLPCTVSGSGMYSRPVAAASPFLYAQSKNFITAAERAGSVGSFGSSMKVADSIGQVLSPGWSFRLTAKFCPRPVGVCRRGLECFHGRGDEGAGLVLKLHGGQVVLAGVGVFVIADAAARVVDRGGDAVVALGAGADRPAHAGVRTDLALPARADRREVGREHKGRARPVRAIHRRDRHARQCDAGIDLGELRRRSTW